MDKLSEFQEKLEYALTQARPFPGLEWPWSCEIQRFNLIVEEISKLDLLPAVAYQRLLIN